MCYKIVFDYLYLNTDSDRFNIRITFFFSRFVLQIRKILHVHIVYVKRIRIYINFLFYTYKFEKKKFDSDKLLYKVQ